MELPIEDQTATYSGPDEDTNKIARFGLELDVVNSNRANVRVVLDEDREVNHLFQALLEGNVAPLKVGREDNTSGFSIPRTRRADADRLYLVELEVTVVNCVFDATRDPLDDGIRAAL